MEKIKIDIALSDIEMPAVNGLDLQKIIIERWPRCKVIFLTGYNDFNFIQSAIRSGSIDYLLKTEGNEAIIRAVEKSINLIEQEWKADQFIAKSKQRMHMATPYLQQQYLLDILHGDSYSLSKVEEQFADLSIPIHREHPILLLIGRVDYWVEDISMSGRIRLLFAIKNIAEELFSAKLNIATVTYDKQKVVWILQPEGVDNHEQSEIWKQINLFIEGTVETIQTVCKNLLKLSVSFVLSHEQVSLANSASKCKSLITILESSLGYGDELLLTEGKANLDEAFKRSQEFHYQMELVKQRIEKLASFLNSGQSGDFQHGLDELKRVSLSYSANSLALNKEIYFQLSSIFLSYLNRWSLFDVISKQLDVNRLMLLSEEHQIEHMTEYFMRLAAILFERRKSDFLSHSAETVRRVNEFIDQNLDQDLSLVTIGERFAHNPKYLSRMYKQAAGKGVSDFILQRRLEKAKELLAERQKKINEISKMTGFISERNFFRIFKKETGLTPKEYQDTCK
jgi:two-component system response regulator YesN